nr:TGS domain-containing protein [Rappaport israeli]
MVAITLPDGSQKQFNKPTNGAEIAASIGEGLAKAAIAIRVNDRLQDLSDPIEEDASIAIITARDEEGLEIIRHSCAHLLGHALKQLWPEAKMVIGPVIENGFYYDIASEHRFNPDDLEQLEQRMHELAQTGYRVEKVWTPVEQAKTQFQKRGEDYKVRLIEDFDNDIQTVGLYHHQEYLDMCRGPHVPIWDI